MRVFGLSGVIALCLISGSLSGQTFPINRISISSGARARITDPATPRSYVKVTVLDVSHDSLHYTLALDGTSQTLAWDHVARMDVMKGRHRHVGAGAALGLLIGAGAGALIGSSSASGNDGYTPSAVGGLAALGGGLVGLVTGGVAGIFWKTDTWIPVALPRPATIANDSR
jgi:hypothetical protein